METRRIMAWLIVLVVVGGLAVARILTVRARRRERRQAAKPIDIVADTHRR